MCSFPCVINSPTSYGYFSRVDFDGVGAISLISSIAIATRYRSFSLSEILPDALNWRPRNPLVASMFNLHE